jgi:hypothetical protein
MIAPWKLSMKTFLSPSQESIELLLTLSSHVSATGVQSHREVDNLGGVGASYDFYDSRVTS